MKTEFKSLTEELNRIKELSGVKLTESTENSDWETLYTWAKSFSTDNEKFLNDNDIKSGEWLKRAIQGKKITPEDIDAVTKKSESGVKFSELPMLKTLTNKK